MIEEIFLEDYEIGAVRSTTRRMITEADVVLHAGPMGDCYHHSMSKAGCATPPSKARIAHGTLVFSVAVGLTAGKVNPLAMTYGYEHLRFPKPVFIGDTITSKITVVEKRDHQRPTDGIVSEKLEVTNQRGETVLACEHLLLVKRREALA